MVQLNLENSSFKETIKKVLKKIVHFHYLKKPITIISLEIQLYILIIYNILFGLIKNIYFNNVSQFSNLQNIKTNEIFKILFFLFLCMDIYVVLWVLYGLLKKKGSVYYIIIAIFFIFDLCDLIYDGITGILKDKYYFIFPVRDKTWLFMIIFLIQILIEYYAIVIANTLYLNKYYKRKQKERDIVNINNITILNNDIDDNLTSSNSETEIRNSLIISNNESDRNMISNRNPEAIVSELTLSPINNNDHSLLIHNGGNNGNLIIRTDNLPSSNDIRYSRTISFIASPTTVNSENSSLIKGKSIIHANTYSFNQNNERISSPVRSVSPLLTYNSNRSSLILTSPTISSAQYKTQMDIQNKIQNQNEYFNDNNIIHISSSNIVSSNSIIDINHINSKKNINISHSQKLSNSNSRSINEERKTSSIDNSITYYDSIHNDNDIIPTYEDLYDDNCIPLSENENDIENRNKVEGNNENNHHISNFFINDINMEKLRLKEKYNFIEYNILNSLSISGEKNVNSEKLNINNDVSDIEKKFKIQDCCKKQVIIKNKKSSSNLELTDIPNHQLEITNINIGEEKYIEEGIKNKSQFKAINILEDDNILKDKPKDDDSFSKISKNDSDDSFSKISKNDSDDSSFLDSIFQSNDNADEIIMNQIEELGKIIEDKDILNAELINDKNKIIKKNNELYSKFIEGNNEYYSENNNKNDYKNNFKINECENNDNRDNKYITLNKNISHSNNNDISQSINYSSNDTTFYKVLSVSNDDNDSIKSNNKIFNSSDLDEVFKSLQKDEVKDNDSPISNEKET